MRNYATVAYSIMFCTITKVLYSGLTENMDILFYSILFYSILFYIYKETGENIACKP
jgi:hypothetical protein